MEIEIVKDPSTVMEDKPENTSKEKQGARLENWYQEFFPFLYLNGNVYDHPLFEDGTFIHTSRVKYINTKLGIAETMNTVYILVGKEVQL